MGFILAFLVFSSVSFSTTEHEYHLSNTEVRYNEQESALQITTRIFIDDLEETLGNEGHQGLFLCTEREPIHADSLVQEYLNQNLLISVDGDLISLDYLGKEISDDLIAVWCYLEVPDVSPKELIEVENNVLLETFDDQKNIVNLKTDSGTRAMFILENGKNKGSIEL